jgi:cytochrome c peroxidase
LLGLTLALTSAGVVPTAAAGDDFTSLDDVVDDRDAAVKLGKALFWDQQIGSDNGSAQSCASCHYQGGADSHPARIEAGRLANGKIGSLGVRFSNFMGVNVIGGVAMAKDMMAVTGGEMGTAGDWMITGRQAPPSVESDNTHNFWDGRANNIFNGCDPSGEIKDCLYKRNSSGTLVPASFAIENFSQGSQAVGPPNNEVEMAAMGRTFAELGFKMARVTPLGMQYGDLADELHESGSSYEDLIEAAFGTGLADFIGDEIVPGVQARVMWDGAAMSLEPVRLTEHNFSLFFGIAVALYEQTLTAEVPSPTKRQKKAFKRMKCAGCHNLDGSSHAKTNDEGRRAFASSGVEDAATGDAGVALANLNLNSPEPLDEDVDAGVFKSSHLFNLRLTAPYFHDGSAMTIEDVVDFYIAGGNRVSQDVDSHVRPLARRMKKHDRKHLIAMLEELEDPRVGAGAGPYAHPSLDLVLGDGTCIELLPSGNGNGGLDYTEAAPCD